MDAGGSEISVRSAAITRMSSRPRAQHGVDRLARLAKLRVVRAAQSDEREPAGRQYRGENVAPGAVIVGQIIRAPG